MIFKQKELFIREIICYFQQPHIFNFHNLPTSLSILNYHTDYLSSIKQGQKLGALQPFQPFLIIT